MKLSDWVAENVRLSEDIEATGGRYDLTRNPFYREILDSLIDPSCRTVALKKSTQIGGTLTGVAAMLAIAEVDPAPGMCLAPDLRECLLMRDRVYANAAASRTTKHMDMPERRRNARCINLRSMLWHLASAASAQGVRGKPCKRVFRHEVDVYPRGKLVGGDVLMASKGRVTRFVESMIYSESTPREDPSVIDDLYRAGDQRTWQCPCPKCGHHQELRFFTHRDGEYKDCGGIVGHFDSNGHLLPIDTARKLAKYRCEKGCILTNTAVKAMVLKGAWVPRGCHFTKAGKLVGKALKSPRNRSYHLWRIHSPTKTLGELVEEYIEAKTINKLREFWENTLGLKYRSSRAIPNWKVLGQKLERPYKRGTFPARAHFLVGTADVQVEGVWWIVRAWGHMAESWLVDYGFCERYLGSEEKGKIRSDLAQLRIVMADRFFETSDGTANPYGRTSAKPRIVGIDSNHRPRDVHEFIVDSYGPHQRHVRAIRGESPLKTTDARWRESVVERPRRGGDAYPGGPRPLWSLFTTSYKEAQLEKYLLKNGEPGSLYLPSGVTDWGKDYLQQVTNESPVIELDKRTKRPKTVWRVQNEGIGNHLWDTEVYNACLADVLITELGLTWDSSTWRTGRARSESGAQEIDITAREHMPV